MNSIYIRSLLNHSRLYLDRFIRETKRVIFTKYRFVDILIHVLIMTMFVTSLFFFYTSYEISTNLKESLKKMSENALAKYKLNTDYLTYSQLELCEKSYSKERYDNAMKQITEESDKLPFQYRPNIINMSITYTIWFIVLIGLIVYVIHFRIPVKELIVSNIILFLFLGGIEYYFIYNILKYVPVNFSLITDTLFDHVIKFLYVPPY